MVQDKPLMLPPPKHESGSLSIGELAKLAGVATSAIRYYERVGLLPPPPRVSGHRRYDATAVRLLTTLRFAQRAGFSVAEIRTLFHGFGANVPPSARWRVLATQKLAELDELIASAERMRVALNAGMRCGCVRVEDCVIDVDAGCSLPGPVSLARATSRRTPPARSRARRG